MAEDSSARKIELVGQLRAEVDKLAQSFKAIDASSSGFARNVSQATGMLGGVSGNAASISAANAMSGAYAGANSGTSGVGYQAASASMSVGAVPAAATAPPGTIPGMGAATTTFGGLTNTLAAAGMGLLNSGLGIPGLGGFGKDIASAALGAAGMALPQVEDAMQLQNLVQRQRFYGYTPMPGQPGYRTPGDLYTDLTRAGLPTSPMDAPTAANYAIAMGMLPAQGSYRTFMTSAAMISTLAPGAGITGGVEAMGALGQARNVNMLRAIGINARNIGTNQVNSFESVVNQLWSILTTANNGVSPDKEDIANSLLPGNALDSLLNQYFDDPVLRQSVVAALIQRASGRGLSKLEMMATGPGRYDKLLPGMGGQIAPQTGRLERGEVQGTNLFGALASGILSEGDINREYLQTYLASADPVVQGLISANLAGGRILGAGREMLLKGIGGFAMKPAVETLAFVDAFSGLGQGAGGLMLQGILGGAGKLAAGPLSGALSRIPILNQIPNFLSGAGSLAALLGLQAIGGGAASSSGNMAVPASYGGSSFQGPAIVNVNMNGTYTDGHAAGVAIANRTRRTTITRRTVGA